MPVRPTLNANFFAVAVVLGMNAPVTDATRPEVRFALLSADIFLGQDRRTRRYMRYYRSTRSG
ncbi:MAG: hypothetical protein SWK90_00305 [Chloroflexota bacterium]|nr:hypothetical protein [Chloroflexota bacterium]